MEGVLSVRKRRSKLLHSWQKRYVVLTRDGVLKEYAEVTTLRQSEAAIAGSGMVLKQEMVVRGASVTVLPFHAVGRPHAFRVVAQQRPQLQLYSSAGNSRNSRNGTTTTTTGPPTASDRITLAAKSSTVALQWITALERACGLPEREREREHDRGPRHRLVLEIDADHTMATAITSPHRRGSRRRRSSSNNSVNGSSSSLARHRVHGGVHGRQSQSQSQSQNQSPSRSENRSAVTVTVPLFSPAGRGLRAGITRLGSTATMSPRPGGAGPRPLELPSHATPEPEVIEVRLTDSRDIMRLLNATEWYNHHLRTKTEYTAGGMAVQRGSLVVAVNGIFLQTLTRDQAQAMLHPTRVPLTLRCLRTPYKRGVLHCKVLHGLTTHLKMLATYRNAHRQWVEQLVEIDGDVLTTCQPSVAYGSESGGANAASGKDKRKSMAGGNKRVIALVGGCTVKSVEPVGSGSQRNDGHEDQVPQFGFLVAVKAYSVLFQARSQEQMVQWMDAIQRAINIAEGCIPGALDVSLDTLQLESSMHMRRHEDLLLEGAEVAPRGLNAVETSGILSCSDTTDDSEEEELAAAHDGHREGMPSALPSVDGVAFSDDQLSEMLEFLQLRGRFTEALQLIATHSAARRSVYWRVIFQWAMDPMDTDSFHELLQLSLHHDDVVQVEKDVPRTSKWLQGSAGAATLTESETRVRLKVLETVLHGFLVSCRSDTRTDAGSVRDLLASDTAVNSAEEEAQRKSFYMQGMNGIAFVILAVVGDEDPVIGCQLLRGVVTHILPHVFGIRSSQAGGDHFDLFSSLIEVGKVLDEVVRMHLPAFHEAMETAGLPVCLLAYKWFPTLFSDISLSAHRSQLRFDTLLAIWDVCLLMGIEGMFAVALALFSAAEEDVSSLRNGASVELVSRTIADVVANIHPHDLVVSVCEVLEMSSHPVLLKLRNAHRRRLQLRCGRTLGAESAFTSNSKSDSPPELATMRTNRDDGWPRQPTGGDDGTQMTVRDLDSGNTFRISRTGSMLLAVKPAAGAPQ